MPAKRVMALQSVPRFGQVFWVDFPDDFITPEFGPPHPGIVIRAARFMDEPCMVVPMTTVDQGEAKYAYKLPRNPNPKERERQTWAVCDHIYTVALERLRPMADRYAWNTIPRITDADMYEICRRVDEALKRVRQTVDGGPPAPPTVAVRPKGPRTLSLRPPSSVQDGQDDAG